MIIKLIDNHDNGLFSSPEQIVVSMCSFVTCCTVQALRAGSSLEVDDIENVTHAVTDQASSDVILPYFPRLIMVYPRFAQTLTSQIRILLFNLQLKNLGFADIDALDFSQAMLDLAKSKGIYKNYICDSIQIDGTKKVEDRK